MEDGVREKCRAEAYKRARPWHDNIPYGVHILSVHVQEEMHICRLPGRRSTPRMSIDWGYTYRTLFKQRAENPPEYEKP